MGRRLAPADAKPLSDTPAKSTEDDANLRALREEHAGSAALVVCLSFAGATIEARSLSNSFLAGTHYPGTLTLAGQPEEVVGWINSVPYHQKDAPLETRACLTEPFEWWLPARFGLDARARTLELHYYVEGATEPSAAIICCPNAAFAGGLPGLRLRTLREPSFSASLATHPSPLESPTLALSDLAPSTLAALRPDHPLP